MNCELQDKIFNVTGQDMNNLALGIFRHQVDNSDLYGAFVKNLGINPLTVDNITLIPFLPIRFFKSHAITTGEFTPELIFESSGTTRSGNSRHLVRSAALYRESFVRAFEFFYGDVQNWCIVGLLPSYLERQNSSLVVMVDELIKLSGHQRSGFYLNEFSDLAALLRENEKAGQKTILIGVTFALLDFAEVFKFPMNHTIVMETGGMKGRRRELTRMEVHGLLKSAWHLKTIHSEYGMTELLSQAYSTGEGVFRCPPWMHILLREEDDPLNIITVKGQPRNGLVNVIDLVNIHSCSFIATDDIGRLYPDGSFEITGRMDSSDVRGCSLLYV